MAKPASKMRWIIPAAILLCVWFQPALALDAAGTLLKKVEKELKQGRTLSACKLARGFAKFDEENPTYLKARDKLLEHGISVEDPMGSYTMLKIVKLQNKTEAKRSATRSLPKAGIRRNVTDAWGYPLRIELVAQKGFLYIVRSAGPDKKYLTDDDMIVGVREDQTSGLDRQHVNPKAGTKTDLKSAAQRSGRDSLLGSQIRPKRQETDLLPGGKQASPSQGSQQKPKDGELEVSLDEMLKK